MVNISDDDTTILSAVRRFQVRLSDRLIIAAGAGRRPTLFPQLFPIPDPGHHLVGQWEPELMREHTHLAAMVGFVSNHVAQHFQANRPRLRPAVAVKLLHPALTIAERISEHLPAASGALGQSSTGLLRGAVHAVELWWNFQVGSGKPDPFGAYIMYVGEDRCYRADLARGRSSPDARVKTFDKKLVHAIVSSKDPDRSWAGLRLNLG
jgi:hypothetical protein